MIIKLLPGNPCHLAIVGFSQKELLRFGIGERELTLQNSKTRVLLVKTFALLRETAGLDRDGTYVSVVCRPLKSGGCRFTVDFTGEPSGRCFEYREADDLLDAVGQLRKRGQEDVLSKTAITDSGGTYKIYIPPDAALSEGDAALLSEYAI